MMITQEEIVSSLRRSKALEQVSSSLLRWLAETAALQALAPMDRFFSQGESGDAMYVLLRGEVGILRGGEQVATLHAGDCFGEAALLTQKPRNATALALRDCEALQITRHTFESLLRESPSFRRAIKAQHVERKDENEQIIEPEPIWVIASSTPEAKQFLRLFAQTIHEQFKERVDLIPVGGSSTIPPALLAEKLRLLLRRNAADYAFFVVEPEATPEVFAAISQLSATVIVIESEREIPSPSFASIRSLHRVFLGRRKPPKETTTLKADVRLWLTIPPDTDECAYLPRDAQDQMGRLARAITRRRVGIALSGGAAWGYAHCAMLRGLAQLKIPVDLVAGVSFGSMAGAFYASRGLDGIEHLIELRTELALSAAMCTLSPWAAHRFFETHIPQKRLEDLPTRFFPVAVDMNRGEEKIFYTGSIAKTVYASCAFPGIFKPALLDGVRYVDACVKNNVPASCLVEEGADFVIASNAVHPPRQSESPKLSRFPSPTQRLHDVMRSVYLVISDAGQRQASCANTTFCADLSGFWPTDFTQAPQIIEAAEKSIEPWLEELSEKFRAFCFGARRG